MSEYTKREWIIEHDWSCIHCGHTNPGREDKCVNCGKPIDETHEEIVPRDMSYENRVKDSETIKILSGKPDWICFYCQHRNRAETSKCIECGSEKVKEAVSSGEDTSPSSSMFDDAAKPAAAPIKKESVPEKKKQSSPYREPTVTEPPKPQKPDFWARVDEKYKHIVPYLWAAFICILLFFVGKWLYDYYRWIPTTAKVVGVSWGATTEIKTRTIQTGHSWRHNEPRYVFNETCHQEISGYHNCNPYSCNPHRESYSCNCRQVCVPVESCRTVCSSTGRRSSRCREVCSTRNSCRTSCSTCYRTVTDTCYRRCPDYDDMCDYSYPSWRTVQTLTTSGRDHNITYPQTSIGLVNCGDDPERNHINNSQIESCKQTEMEFTVQFDVPPLGIRNRNIPNIGEFNNYRLNSTWPAFYNKAGNFSFNN